MANNKNIYRLLVLMLLISLNGYSQQDPMFTQYLNNPVLINPAYTAIEGKMEVNGIFRKQWVGFNKWEPTTTSISITSPYRDKKVGIGFTFIHDMVYPSQQTGVYLDYAYHLKFSNKTNLSLGLKGGFNYFDIDLLQLYANETDEHISLNGKRSRFLPNFGVGAYYFGEKFHVGMSVPKLLRNNISDRDNTNEIVGREERHYFITAGYLFTIDEPDIRFMPSTMLRVVNGAPPSIDLNGTFIFRDRMWLGAMYRIGDTMAAFARFQVNNKLQVGYAYDLVNSRLKSSGTHEIFIKYHLPNRRQRVVETE